MQGSAVPEVSSVDVLMTIQCDEAMTSCARLLTAVAGQEESSSHATQGKGPSEVTAARALDHLGQEIERPPGQGQQTPQVKANSTYLKTTTYTI